MGLFRVLLAGSAVVAFWGCAESASAADLRIPWLDGAALGMGYDAATGSLMRESCADVKPLEAVLRDESNLDFERADTKEELISKLSASAGGEARFSIYSGSARASFAKSLEVQRNDTTIVVQNEVSSEEVGSVRTGAVDNGGDLVKFRRRCGTHYVSTIVYGGELLMALQASDQSTLSKTQFEANVRAAVGAASGSAEYQESLQRLQSQNRLRITGRKAGGGKDEAYSVSAFAAQVQNFRSQVLENRRAHVLYAIVSPYVGFQTSTTKSATVDLGVEKLVLMDEKLVTLDKVTREPAMYDVDAADLPLVAQERYRLWDATASLRTDIEACSYPIDPATVDPPECQKIRTYAMPPTRAMGDGVPERFASDCRTTEAAIPPMDLKNGKRLRGDGRIGGRMLIEFEIQPTVVDNRIVRVRVTERASEPGTSKNPAEEDIVEFYEEADVYRTPGCMVVEVPKPISVAGRWFTHDLTESYNYILDKATCISTARLSGGGGFRSRTYDAFRCNVSFLPLRGMILANEELFEDGKVRPRQRFESLGWLTVK